MTDDEGRATCDICGTELPLTGGNCPGCGRATHAAPWGWNEVADLCDEIAERIDKIRAMYDRSAIRNWSHGDSSIGFQQNEIAQRCQEHWNFWREWSSKMRKHNEGKEGGA